MNLPDIPLFAMLRERMSWLNQRRTAHSLGIRSTSTLMYGHVETPEHWVNQLLLLRGMQQETGGFTDYAAPDVEASLNGNSVSLEGEMMKMADTQASYQAATNLYSKAVDMMRTAIGRTS